MLLLQVLVVTVVNEGDLESGFSAEHDREKKNG